MNEEEKKLRAENAKLVAENQKLVADNEEYKRKLFSKSSATECPFCRLNAAALQAFVPHEIPDLASVGEKQALYKCTNCGREFRKDKAA